MTVSADLERVWREEWGRLLALLVARYRRLDLAEDALADAFEAAARVWPAEGRPVNPAAWLLTAARRRAVDRQRAEAVAARKEPLLLVEAATVERAQRIMADSGEVVVSDELARLVFLCAHPALAPESAGALALRLVLGVSTADIARLYLTSEATVAARITRAKRKIGAVGIPFQVPSAPELPQRVETVARVAYLAFTAGYAAPSGAELHRPESAGEAIRLVRVVRRVLPGHRVLDVLLALMLLQHSRRDSRVSGDGGVILLGEQDRTRWHTDEIDEAVALLDDVLVAPESLLGWTAELALQGAIAACHATARVAADTDWAQIALLYARLDDLTGSPIVRLNRAVAVAEADGPNAGLALLDGLDDALPRSHRLAAVRAELLVRAGRPHQARTAYEEAIELCDNAIERDHLKRRQSALPLPTDPGWR